MKKKLKQGCYITWVDSEYTEVDQHEVDKRPPPLIHSIGWLILDTSTHYVISQELHKETDWHRRTTSIPKRCVEHFEKWEMDL